MKKRTNVKLFGLLGLFLGAITLSSCVANFCSDTDKANIAYPYEQGVTVYVDSRDEIPEEYRVEGLSFQPFSSDGNTDLWAYIPVTADGGFGAKKASFLNDTILANAKKNGYVAPSFEYFKEMDNLVLRAAIAEANAEQDGTYLLSTIKATDINPFNFADCAGNEEGAAINENSVLRNYGYVKFISEDEEGTKKFDFGNWLKWNDQIEEKIGASNCPGSDFVLLYQNAISNTVNNIRSCITTQGGKYGHYGVSNNWSVSMETTSWGDAWGKGLFEGLIVYPVAWLVDSLSLAMDPALSGVGQICALIITTLIVRVILALLTLKGTIDQQKMQLLQPQLAKIQAKYPNSSTNQAEKMRLSQEQMALYKRNKVSMFSTFVTLIIQFPVFISVWGALQGSAVLSSGEVLNLRLSDTIQSVLLNTSGTWYLNTSGWWTALVLFILMAVLQFLAMKLPQWITKRKTRNQPKLTANPTADKNAKTMKYVSYGMLIFTIFLGFALPAAMGVYWAIGALLSMIQTVVVQLVIGKTSKKAKHQK